jgi:adenylate cyclase
VTLRLEVIEGPTAGQCHTITGVTVIGREASSCGVVIPAPTVSRNHAIVRPDEAGPGYVIEDLDSRSGTYVNGARTRRAVLLEGDRVQVGPALLRVGLREDVLSGQVDAGTLDEPAAKDPPRLQTLRLSIDAVSFKLRAKDLDPGASPAPAPAPPDPPAAPPPALAGPETASERLEAIIELSHALAAAHDRSRLVREVARRLFTLFPTAKRVGYFDVEPGPEKPAIVPRILVDRDARAGVSPRSGKISRAIVDQAVAQRQAVLSDDVSRDERFLSTKSSGEIGVRSVICAPLCVGDRVLGALYAETADGSRPFDEGALRFLAGIATVVASAAENGRLLQRVQAETARRAVLERYFSPDMLERVLSGEVPLASDGDVRSGTILFTDIRGFTKLTSVTEPKTLVATLNAYFEAMQRIVFRSRGTVERFGGDSILAYWGVMDTDPHGPSRATRAALLMQNELFRLNRELAMVGKPTLEVGIGVNTGEVIAGNVGSAERYEFTILGDAVNLARRIEDLAGPGEVLLGEATRAALGDQALVRLLPPREVKGRSEPVTLAAVLGMRSEDAGRSGARFDLAIACSLSWGESPPGNARLVALEVGPRGAFVEVLAPIGAGGTGEAIGLSVRLPTGARARDRHGLTVELARPIELEGHVDLRSGSEETVSPVAMQRLFQAEQAGLDVFSIRLDDPRPLLMVLGVRPAG